MEEKDHQFSNHMEKKKITITVDEDDPCLKREEKVEEVAYPQFRFNPGVDPRFQQQNQTQRCFVMYTDFYRCEHILGKGTEACTWFKDVFTSMCPNAWVKRWDELRVTGRLPWHKYRTQGPFPGHKYGE
ncbi:uncharacterized protein LOC126848194 [Cataglyphis hispanica]|uniref:uncharacterized protein LOC126848194 n=1 Tax=Cataglyphis hispanica TaxID=1086592 RepID=UPI0021806376|nr:uncharacterized protein LOC126848194 [Cataglyphis hispanica]